MKHALALLPAVLLLAACGGGSDDGDGKGTGSSLSADEQKAADNLAAQIIRSGTVSGRGSDQDALTDLQAQCIAEGAVGDVGLGDLQEYGIVTDDLLVNKDIQGVEMTADDADALAGVFVGCIDVEALFEKQYLAAAGPKASEKVRACIESAVDEQSVRASLSASFQGRSTPASRQLSEKVTSCTGQGSGAE